MPLYAGASPNVDGVDTVSNSSGPPDVDLSGVYGGVYES
jgi:hypothetical protein